MAGNGHGRAGTGRVAAIGLIGLFVLSSLLVTVSAPSSRGGPTGFLLPPLSVITDGKTISLAVGLHTILLTDNASPPPSASFVRTYTITLYSIRPHLALPVLIQTRPGDFWSVPLQMPSGADNIPALAGWTWWVTTGAGVNDTANWSVSSSGVQLERTTTWSSQSYSLFGLSHPTVNVSVDPMSADGTSATGGGYILNAGPYPYSIPNAPGYTAMAAALNPSLLRFSLTTAATFVGWNSTAGQPTLSFTGLDRLFQFANSTGGRILVSFPAGNWGDGNIAPNGTPVSQKVLLNFHGMKGYFLTPAAMYALVSQVANHTSGAHETITYWSIGNEVPLNSTTIVTAYIRLINAASTAIHSVFPNALVGTDDMLTSAYTPLFAKRAVGIGFLSFHYYQSWGMCVDSSGRYCPPQGQPRGTPLPTMFARPAYTHGAGVYSPLEGQQEWYNLTGNWLPVLNAETNMAAYGSAGSSTAAVGTDPRIPNLEGAAWLGSLLVDSSQQNVSSIGYFTLTSRANLSTTITNPRGGFGFGLTNVTPTGQITYFAPFHVLRLWDSYMRAGHPGRALNDSDPSAIRAYAVMNGPNVDVALVNRFAVPVTVELSVTGHYGLRQVSTVDQRTFAEQYDPYTDSTTVIRSGVNVTTFPSSLAVTIDGYGFAIAEFAPGAGDIGASGSPSGTPSAPPHPGTPPGAAFSADISPLPSVPAFAVGTIAAVPRPRP